MVSPPTSGQPEEVESEVYDPLRSIDEVPRKAAPGQKTAGQDSAGQDSVGPGSAGQRSDRWFLEQRPPHWG
ncbi:hypothetical protein GCM10009618_20500 [Nesterenkonia lacusekhoensis]